MPESSGSVRSRFLARQARGRAVTPFFIDPCRPAAHCGGLGSRDLLGVGQHNRPAPCVSRGANYTSPCAKLRTRLSAPEADTRPSSQAEGGGASPGRSGGNGKAGERASWLVERDNSESQERSDEVRAHPKPQHPLREGPVNRDVLKYPAQDPLKLEKDPACAWGNTTPTLGRSFPLAGPTEPHLLVSFS